MSSFPWTRNERILRRYQRLVNDIHQSEDAYQDFSEIQFKQKTEEFQNRHKAGESLDSLLIEAFALVMKASHFLIDKKWAVCGEDLKWNLIPYDVQIMGGIGLFEGKIVEMATGEGKTLTAVFPLYLHAIHGGGVHLATVNDYLAKRDSEWMGGIYHLLGLKVGCVVHGISPDERRKQYCADITYGTGKEFGFDYLRDHSGTHARDEIVQSGHYYILVDEVDCVLIDEARTPLIISGLPRDDGTLYEQLNQQVLRMIQVQYQKLDKMIHTLKKREKEEFSVDEEGVRLLLVHKAYPHQTELRRYLSDQNMFKLMRRAETFLMRDLLSRRIKEVLNKKLLFVVEEAGKNAYFTDRGMRFLSQEDEDRFILPELYNENVDDENKHFGEEEYLNYEKRRRQVHTLQNILIAHTIYHRDVDYCVLDQQVILVDVNTGRLMYGRRLQNGLHQAIEAKEDVKISPETHTIATISIQNYHKLYETLAGMTGTATPARKEFLDIYDSEVVVIPTHRPVRRINYSDQFFRTHKEKVQAIIKEIQDIHAMGRPILVGTTTVEHSDVLSRRLEERGIEHQVLNARYHEREAKIIRDAGKKGAVTIATNMAGRGTDIRLDPDILKWPVCSLVKQEPGGCGYINEYKCKKNVPCGLHVIGAERHESRRIDLQLLGRSARQGDPGSSRFFISLEDNLLRLYGHGKLYKGLKLLSIPGLKDLAYLFIEALLKYAQEGVELKNFGIRRSLLEYDDILSIHRKIIYELRDRFLSSENSSDFIKALEEEDADRFKGLRDKYQQKVESEGVWFQIEERLVFINKLDLLWVGHIENLERLREGMGFRALGNQPSLIVDFRNEAFRLFEEMMDEFKNTVINELLE